jgi:hypothetical protein
MGVIKEECGRKLFSSGNPSGVRHIKWAALYNFSERLVRFFLFAFVFVFRSSESFVPPSISLKQCKFSNSAIAEFLQSGILNS